MIIQFIHKGTTFSELSFPTHKGILNQEIKPVTDWHKRGSNKADIVIEIEYKLKSLMDDDIFTVIKSRSMFEVFIDHGLTELHLFQLIRQAESNLAAHIFNEAPFIGDNFRILESFSFDSLFPELERIVDRFGS